MNSGSEKRLSMDELMERNRPTHMTQTMTQLPPEVHPTKEEWAEMTERLYTLSYHAEKQTESLKELRKMIEQLPNGTQMDELLKRTTHLEQMAELAGKPKEWSYSLPSSRPTGLQLSHLVGPILTVLLIMAGILFLRWLALDVVWNELSQMLP